MKAPHGKHHTGHFKPGDTGTGIITRNGRMTELLEYTKTVAKRARVVLITGPTGSGKELFSRLVHAHNKQLNGRRGSLVTLNVSSVDDHFFTDTLCGHAKGAYSGAVGGRPGLITRAHGGTLFLDEIGDLPLVSQTKLLRLIEYGDYYPLGSDTTEKADALIVLATHKPLDERVSEGKFREDLYYRINAYQIEIPPLRRRKEDIPLLIRHFFGQFAEAWKIETPRVDADALELLYNYEFPGNVRELKHMLEYCLSKNEHHLDKTHLESWMAGNRRRSTRNRDEKTGWKRSLESLEHLPTLKEMDKALVAAVATRSRTQEEAARTLGISQAALNKKLKKYRITWQRAGR